MIYLVFCFTILEALRAFIVNTIDNYILPGLQFFTLYEGIGFLLLIQFLKLYELSLSDC